MSNHTVNRPFQRYVAPLTPIPGEIRVQVRPGHDAEAQNVYKALGLHPSSTDPRLVDVPEGQEQAKVDELRAKYQSVFEEVDLAISPSC